jgi:hypothetical protein
MDISPVSAMRPVNMIRPSTGTPDVPRVVQTEYRGQSGDDEYTPADRKAERGLEDEDNQMAAEEPTPVTADGTPSATVSFFA